MKLALAVIPLLDVHVDDVNFELFIYVPSFLVTAATIFLYRGGGRCRDYMRRRIVRTTMAMLFRQSSTRR